MTSIEKGSKTSTSAHIHVEDCAVYDQLVSKNVFQIVTNLRYQSSFILENMFLYVLVYAILIRLTIAFFDLFDDAQDL